MKNNSPFVFASIETTAFSGATLLAMLLGSSPHIATIGEVSGLVSRNDPMTYLCSCGEKIIDCEFWKQITNRMKSKGHNFDVGNFNTEYDPRGSKLLNRFRIGSVRNSFIDRMRDNLLFSIPSEKQKIIEYVQRNVDFVESVLATTNKRIFLDSSKSRMLIRALPVFSNFDVRAIHLVRRVEGVVASSYRRNPNTNIAKLAQDWAKRHKRLDITLRTWSPEKHILVRYEDLCQHTEETINRILRFLDVEEEFLFSNYKNVKQHVVGNPMRLKPVTDIEVDERWKIELSELQKKQIMSIAGKLNQQYGYEEN